VLVTLAALRGAGPALTQIADDVLSLEAESTSRADHTVQPLGPGELEFADVSFSYGPGLPQVLRHVDLRVSPGESVAVVGASGAGKSTILDLVLGLLQPTSGAITINGEDMSSVRSSWQRSIGYVPQDVILLDDSIRANVALGQPDSTIDDAQVWRALTMAELADTIRAMPEGLGTSVGERGVRLSGGQRQRAGIARALYSSPSLLVLDEATSSLDTDTEARITQTVESLRGKLTQIIVTHRLSTVRKCDRIYVLERGSVVAVGTFQQLVESSPQFAEMVRRASVDVPRAPSIGHG
jgi:ATP-binding cassette subfamily C protein